MKRPLNIAVVMLVMLAAGLALVSCRSQAADYAIPANAVPLAVIGDSNSHSYQDAVSFPPGSRDRGGDFRPRTFQWTEVIARLRGGVLDPGPWLTWGDGARMAAVRGALSPTPVRVPRKQDYLFNFAVSGGGCETLMDGHIGQALRLVALMDTQRERWRNGVVVMRIGMANLSGASFIDQQAQNPDAPAVNAVIDSCVAHIRDAVKHIRTAHPETRIVLVGILDNTNDPLNFARWRSGAALANISRSFDRFDNALRQLAASTPATSFFDDRAWFAQRWGTRGPDGAPAYKTLAFGTQLKVTNTIGDAPHHAQVGDDHAGLVWNALWAQSLVQHLRENAGLASQLPPISDEELLRFVEPLLRPAGAKAPGS